MSNTVQIANYRSISTVLSGVSRLESVSEGISAHSIRRISDAARSVVRNPKLHAQLIAEITAAMRELEEESVQTDDDVLSSPRNRVAAILQSVMAEYATKAVPSPSGLEMAFDNRDADAAVHEALKRSADRRKHRQLRPSSTTPEPLNDRAKIFLVGDFGTGLYGAPVTAKTISSQAGSLDVLLHLGDIYYSGEKDEVRDRFLTIWPRRSDAISRTLNGNHDMYSGGYGYFNVALPAFEQESSYFAMQNKGWTLLFLDTAYKNNDLNKKQVKWLRAVVDNADDRKLVLFSHHPLFSNFKDQSVKLAAKLQELLDAKRITAWYWGHEHHCVMYDCHPLYQLWARCLGHGGMPARRKKLNDLPIERVVGDFNWRRMLSDLTPPCLFLDGPNEFIPRKQDKYLPHGYAIIEFDEDRIHEAVFSPRGEELYSGTIE